MTDKNYKTLELDRVLQLLCDEAVLDKTKASILKITPSNSFNKVNKLQKETASAFSLLAKYSAPSFGNVNGIEEILKKSDVGAVLSPTELLEVSSLLKTISNLIIWRKNFIETEKNEIDYLFQSLTPNKFLEEKIKKTVKSPEEIYDSASNELYDIRRKISSKSVKVRDFLEKTVKGPLSKYLQETVITQRDGRFVVPVRLEYKSEVKGIVHDTSSSGQTLFIEPESVVELNNDIRILKIKEKEEINRILSELSADVSDFSDSIRTSFLNICSLDLIFAKAKLAYKMNAVTPKLNENGVVNLIKARHPLIDKEKVVPVDINLGIDYSTLVITGPNTGGKTVAIKTLGILTLMTMCGLMIPADEKSEISVFENIFSDIGDEQSIEQSLSTFSSHMVNIIDILKNCNSKSLVLLDELCAGTDPVEGAALAKAILIELKNKGVKTLVTTHYPELKIYALDTDDVSNASCEFDVKSLKPTYRLIIGTPGKSNAFAISKRLGLSDNIINLANEQVSEDEMRFERVVSRLEYARQDADRKSREVSSIKEELKRAKSDMVKSKEKLKEEQDKILNDTKNKAADILDNARYRSAELLNELEEMKKSLTAKNAADTVSKAKSLYKSVIESIESEADPVQKFEKGEKLKALPNINDNVYITSINKDATVIETDQKGNRVYVLAGSIKLWVQLEDLRFVKKSKETPQKRIPNVSRNVSVKDKIIKTELDIRGFASDEALIELDKFIDDAYLAGLETVTIIHGKGTGVLRKAVQNHLKHSKLVLSYRIGTFGEGENGVTVAQLGKK